VIAIYGQGEFHTLGARMEMIRYLMTCAEQNKNVTSPSAERIATAQKATKILERLRRLDPKAFVEYE
jgi:hypothetical protein